MGAQKPPSNGVTECDLTATCLDPVSSFIAWSLIALGYFVKSYPIVLMVVVVIVPILNTDLSPDFTSRK